MNIEEALFELSCFLDMIYNMKVLTEEEEKLIGKVETTINDYVNRRE